MEKKDTLFIKSNDFLVQVELDDIYFFTKQQNKVLAVTKNEIIEMHNTLYNISNILSKNTNFIRTHKSFIVNCSLINSIEKYSQNIYIIKFKNIKAKAFITKLNLKLLKDNILIV